MVKAVVIKRSYCTQRIMNHSIDRHRDNRDRAFPTPDRNVKPQCDKRYRASYLSGAFSSRNQSEPATPNPSLIVHFELALVSVRFALQTGKYQQLETVLSGLATARPSPKLSR